MERRLDAATLRRLSVRASCDPKSIKKVFEGRPVRGLAGHRARLVLEEAGLLPAAPDVAPAAVPGHAVVLQLDAARRP